MKKKSLIKYLSLMGLTLVSTSCEKQEEKLSEKNENYPSPLKSNQASKIGYTPMVELMLPDSINNQIIVLTTLLQDVFDDPSVAQTFSEDPKEYFKSKGLNDCNIDLNSVEVKAILALGDNEIRKSIVSNDLAKFVHLLQEKNYISFNNIYINEPFKKYLECEMKSNQDLQNLFKDFPEIYQSPVLVAALFFYVAVFTGVYFGLAVVTVVAMAVEVEMSAQKISDPHGYNFNNPILKLWGLKTNNNDVPVVNELIEQNVNKLVDIIENMDAYKQYNVPMNRKDLKTLIRKPLTQNFIDAGLI